MNANRIVWYLYLDKCKDIDEYQNKIMRETRLTYNCAYLRSTKESLTYDGTGSVEGGTGWYLVVLCQYWAVRVDI